MNNPIFQRLTRYDYHLSLRRDLVVLIIACVVGITLAVINAGDFRFIWTSYWDILAFLIGWLWMNLLPLICLFRSVSIATHELEMSDFRLILISPLPSSRLVTGFFLGALARLRRLLLISAGLLLPIIAGNLLRGRILLHVDCTGGSDFFQLCQNPTVPSSTEWAVWSIFALGIVLSLFGMSIAAVAVGVAVSLQAQKRFPALVMSLPLYLIFAIPYGIFVFLFMSSPLPLDISSVSAEALLTVARNAIILALIPFALSTLILLAATRWIRRTT